MEDVLEGDRNRLNHLDTPPFDSTREDATLGDRWVHEWFQELDGHLVDTGEWERERERVQEEAAEGKRPRRDVLAECTAGTASSSDCSTSQGRAAPEEDGCECAAAITSGCNQAQLNTLAEEERAAEDESLMPDVEAGARHWKQVVEGSRGLERDPDGRLDRDQVADWSHWSGLPSDGWRAWELLANWSLVLVQPLDGWQAREQDREWLDDGSVCGDGIWTGDESGNGWLTGPGCADSLQTGDGSGNRSGSS